MRGLPGSGKSTYAKQIVDQNPNLYKRINRDDMRMMFDNGFVSDKNEKFVKQVRDLLIIKALEDGKSVIVDDTNLSKTNFNRISQLVHKFNKDNNDTVTVEIKNMDTSVEECIERDRNRDRKVGEDVIMGMYRTNILKEKSNNHFSNKQQPVYRLHDPSLPNAIICDLDGTLALMNGRSPFDASTCESDLPNTPVVNMVKHYHALGYKIILASGREDIHKPQTLAWLEKYGISFDQLFMRAGGDHRKDSIVKREIFETHIEGKYNVELVLDDRNQVVDLWRKDLQLPCFQVYYGDF
jgi:predicted kinase